MEERLIKLNENIGDEQAIINKNEVEEIGYCRTCANGSDYFIPIFKDEGLSHELQSKVEKYLHIKVTEMDILPVQLCYQCASTLLAWDTLVQGVQQAEQKLKQLLNQENSVEYKDVELFDTGGNGSIFIDTNDIDSDDEPLSKKQANSTNLQEGGIDCQNSSRKTRMSEGQEMKIDYQQIFKCKTCGLQFNRKYNMKRHEALHAPEPLVCYICGRTYKGRIPLNNHIKNVHTDAPRPDWTCHICDKQCSSKTAYETHKRSHTGERPFICEICGKGYRSYPNLMVHVKLHSNERPYLCTQCGYRCALKSTYLDHCQRHEGIKNAVCSLCNKKFINNYDLTKHMKTHSEVRSFACDYCDSTFVMKRYLKVHLKTHMVKVEVVTNT